MRQFLYTAAAAAALMVGSALAAQNAPANPPPPASNSGQVAVSLPTSLPDVGLVTPMTVDQTTRLMLPVRINGAGPFPFIVDTGAERTVLSREVAQQLNLPVVGRARVVGMAEAVETNLVAPGDLGLEHLTLETGDVPTFSQFNIGAPGLIGIDSLQGHKVVIDFIAQRIDIRPSEARRMQRREESFDDEAITVIARSRGGRMILSNASIDGHRVDIIVDTGGQASVGNLALQRLVQRTQRQPNGLTPGELRTVTGGTLAVQRSQIERISVGGVDFTALPVAYADSPAFTELGLGRRPALLLGMDALRLFDRIAVDFANRRVTFDLPDGARRDNAQRYAALSLPHMPLTAAR